MKLRYLGLLLTFFLLVQHSSEQGFNFAPNPSRPTDGNPIDGDVPPANDHETNLESPVSGGLGLAVDTLRNTTSNLLQRLEVPRDRVLDYIRPAVQSQFSRNVTNFLNSIWLRVQDSNISLIQHPLVRTSIVRPINITLERLKQITAPEDAELTSPEIEVINLEPRPEDEERLRDYMASAATEEDVTATPTLFILEGERTDKHDDVSNDEITDRPVDNDKAATPADEQQQQPAVEHGQPSGERSLNPTKSRRAARDFADYYITPKRVRNLFDNVRRIGMQECLALAVCESHCRPHLYESYYGGSLFNSLINRVEQIQDLNHMDSDYYLDARRFGQQFYDGTLRDGCAMCHARYYCPHEREYMMSRFFAMSDFQ